MSDIIRTDQWVWPAASMLDLEIRGDGRTVYGLAVPFDTPTEIRDWDGPYHEVFRRGAFRNTIRERGGRVKFLANHDRQRLPLGRAVSLREDAAGLVGEFRVSATQAGDEALQLIRDGVLDALSIGFVAVTGGTREMKKGTTPRLVERLDVKLLEVSAVPFPAYESALIGGVRAADTDDRGPDQPDTPGPDQPDERQTSAPNTTPVLAALNAQRRRR